jgi:hypothetical protein
MMDPERLLDTDSQDAASLRERELLACLRPSAGTQTAIWQRIVGQGVLVAGATAATATTLTTAAGATASSVEAGAVVSAVSGAGAATGASAMTATTGIMGSLAAKTGIALIVAAPVLGGTVYLTRGAAEHEQPVATAARIETASQTPQVQSIATEASEPSSETEVVEPLAPEPSKPPAVGTPAQGNADALREENRLLREARSLERAGNPAQALRILNELDRRFAHGALLQEREILRIQSLSATGSTSAAKTRAEQFLKRYPASPYAAHVRSILDGSSR